ncbi:MAG: 5-formyltetrahydrofolate cyclo-ligase [Chitinophagaceae bacterium]
MLKADVRKLYRLKRKELTFQHKQKWDDLLLINFQTLTFSYISSVLSFYPIEENKEINTFIITDYLKFKNPGLQVAFPRINAGDHKMVAIASHEDSSFEKNVYNILEPVHGDIISPAEIDLVLVPMLAFDVNGNRVGYGKGFYDRFLEQCRNDCIKVGLCYFEPVAAIEDAGKFDVPLNFCITPQKVYVF